MSPAMAQLSARLNAAIGFHQRGQLAQAQAIYEEILREQPRHFDALHLLGMIAGQAGNFQEAVQLIDRALRVDPTNAAAYSNRGIALKGLKRWDAALASFDQAIALKADHVSYSNRGNVQRELRQFAAALASYEQALAIRADYAEGYYNRGVLLNDLKRWDEALASFDQAIALKADYAEAYCNRGTVLQERRRLAEALADFDRAIGLRPELAEAHSNRGNVLRELKRFEEALSSCERAIAIKGEFAEACLNRGHALRDLGQYEAAIASYERAIALKPDIAEAYCGRANALRDLKHLEATNAAVASYENALSLNPDYEEAHEGRGHALRDLGQYEAAIASYERAIALKPDVKFLHGLRRFVKMQICDWSGLEADVAQLAGRIERDEAAAMPFVMLALSDSAALQKKAAQIWVREQCPLDTALGALPKRGKQERIRIGYFSADFRDHPVAILTAQLFETHDRSRFEITAFSFGPDTQDEMRTRLQSAFDRFIDVRNQSDEKIALLARSLQIDIAVDLGGYTEGSRTRIFALRAAPLQVSYLGYPGTMGAEYMDYLIADASIIPPEDRRHYAEQLLYVPSYQANDSKRRIADRVFTRAELGLPESGFVFCCFNNSYKITPGMFEIWMRILRRVDGAVLWLSSANTQAKTNLLRAAAERNVHAARLIFAERIASLPEHLSRLRAAGLFIDTFPYNAHTTASDALWAGLPVLTCAGQTFAGRVGASLLTALNVPELITLTAQQYEDAAVELATQPQRLASIRQRLADNRLSTALFDTRSFTRHLEAAYTMIQERHQADLPPQTLVAQMMAQPHTITNCPPPSKNRVQ